MKSNIIHVNVVKHGDSIMYTQAPEPTTPVAEQPASLQDAPSKDCFPKVKVTIAGCGGYGLNTARPFFGRPELLDVRYFDTSMTNSREGEKVDLVIDGPGSGSGSNRAENAKNIERYIPQITDENLGLGDVAIVVFSLSGGSGSVVGPILIREYARRKARPIAVVVADTSSAVGAKNTLNTLKTLTAIAKNNGIYLPMIILSNDYANNRGQVDKSAQILISSLIKMLTAQVSEVDRNDRLNWVDPSRVTGVEPGLKIMSFYSPDSQVDPTLVVGAESQEMVDSLLILTNSPDDTLPRDILPARLKKSGFYMQDRKLLIGKVSSDITGINQIIDHVERMQHTEKSHKLTAVDRLSDVGDSDLIL